MSIRAVKRTSQAAPTIVAWYGPIVMNTEAELRQAFAEVREGTFIKHRG